MQEYCVSPAHLRPRDDDVDYYYISIVIKYLLIIFTFSGTNSQTPLKPVNRVLFSKPQSLSQSGSAVSSEDFLDSRESCGSEDGIEPLKSRSASVDSDDMGMMMGEPVTKENNQENKLPTVLESAGEEKSSNNNPKMNLNLLTPPESAAPMHKVGSSASIKLVGEPVKDNDPLGLYFIN